MPIPRALSPRARSTMPVLSETLISAFIERAKGRTRGPLRGEAYAPPPECARAAAVSDACRQRPGRRVHRAGEVRQQRRMDVDDAAGKGGSERRRQHRVVT